jgi:uncharacterized protein (TIGR03085 family)
VTDHLDARERVELCDLLLELGPDAPTLCEGWRTLDLAAHLVIRERELRTTPGILSDRFAGYTHKRQDVWADKGLEVVVAKIRSGPPLIPWGLPGVRTLVNLNEYAIHHEDVRRANGLGPRTDRPDLDDAIWNLLKRSSGMATRSLKDAGLVLARPNGDTARARKGEPVVTVTGGPVDLALFLGGRKGAAQVELTGPPGAVAAVRAAPFGV